MNNTDNATHHPHDNFFQYAMRNVDIARDFLKRHLSMNILKHLDLSTMRLINTKHIDKHLSKLISDIVYEIKYKNVALHICFLIEHQSKPEKFIVLRILEYVVAFWKYCIYQKKMKTLPLVYPIVLVHNQKPYPYAADLREYIAAPEGLLNDYDLLKFQLIDLATISDEDMFARKEAGLMEYALKHAHEKSIEKKFDPLLPVFEQPGASKDINFGASMLKYLSATVDGSDQECLDYITSKLKKTEGTMKTMYDHIVDIGVEKGVLIGRQEGRQEGQLAMAKNMLRAGFKLADVQRVSGFSQQDIEKLTEVDAEKDSV